jgi:ribosomal protein S18 acetylase RimI-like enzyme
VTLRPATDADRDFLFDVYASTRTEELAPVPWSDDEKDAFLRQQAEAQDAHYRGTYTDTTYSVILTGGEPAGRLYVARWEDEIRIVDIALLPEHRGNGLGTALLQELIEESEAAGKPLSIHVEQNNPARPLYDRLGFEEAGEFGVYVLMRRAPVS